MIKVFLVEDEPPALRKLERMVAAEADLVVCGTASTCADAISGIQRTLPQLTILDVRLPDGTGFEVLQALDEPRDMHVVFLTAYGQYAVDAFDVAALDYLLKPVSQDRFFRAIQRARDRLAQPDLAPKSRFAERFLVERCRSAYFLPVESIYRIAADHNYAVLHSAEGEFVLRTTMNALEKRLDPAHFVRVSRSAIIRIESIRKVRRRGGRRYAVIVNSGEEVACSKEYWTSALERFARS
jgi:DNA-binding LytR/AlgR family response regulator